MDELNESMMSLPENAEGEVVKTSEEKTKTTKKKMKKSTKVILIISCCILALLLAFLIAAKIVLSKVNRNLDQTVLSNEEIEAIKNETDPIDPGFEGPILNSDEVEMPDVPAQKLEESDEIVNILLVGQDRRSGQSRQRSDSMILCTINKKTKTITLTSFMRDLWVRIPEYFDERLNVPYAIAGYSLLNDTLEYNFGVRADHIIEVDFTGFENVIDTIGGVTVTLTGAEAWYMNKVGKGDWSFDAGTYTLNGKQALAYSRNRSTDNDFNRTNRQRIVLNALMEKMRGLSTVQLLQLANELIPFVTTDMTDSEIIGYVFSLAPVLAEANMVSQRIPVDGAYSFAFIDGKSVILMYPEDLETNKQLLKDTLGE